MTDFEWIAGVKCVYCRGEGERRAPGMRMDLSEEDQPKREFYHCQGTGKRFPWMWKACPCSKGYPVAGCCKTCLYSVRHHDECENCFGSDYVLMDAGRETALVRVASVERLGIKIRPNGDVQVGEYWSALALAFTDSLASATRKALEGKEAHAVVQ